MLVLAFNAHEILHALGTKIGKPSQLETWLDTMPRHLREQTRYVWNFCKHGLKDVDDNTPHDPRHAEMLIFFSGMCYRDVFGKATRLMAAFDLRFFLENPALKTWFPDEPLAKLREIYGAADISRQKFLEECLTASEFFRRPPFHFRKPS
jgi:hypothetical protein